MFNKIITMTAAALLAATPGVMADPLSAYDSMTLDSTQFAGPLYLVDDYQWRGVISLPSTFSNPSFRLKGTGSTTNLWGDSTAGAASTPLFSTAVTGQPPITLGGSQSADLFTLSFKENTGKYSLKRTYYQNFSNVTLTDTPTTLVDLPWIMQNSTCFNTNAHFNGKTLRLGGPDVATESFIFIQTTGGIGSMGFWYRNLDDTDPAPGHLDFQIYDASIGFVTIGSLTNIVNSEYRFHEFPFAFAGDITVRLVWSAANNPGNAWIAVDDVTIERPSSYATVSGVAHDPPSPVFTNSVTVSAQVTSAYASNLSVSTRYRIGTNGAFSTVAMTNTSGSTWITDPPIPRTIPGTVQYYVETLFTDPHGDGLRSMYGPVFGTFAPAHYINTDELAGFTHFITTEGWPTTGNVFTDFTNNTGWIIAQSFVKNLSFGSSPIDAVYLNSFQRPENFVQTPWLEHGVGSIELVHRRQGGSSDEKAVLQIYQSTDGNNWTPRTSITNIIVAQWTTNVITLDISDGTYLGFSCTENANDRNIFFGIDRISISYPQAKVAFSNVVIHPYYPSGTDPVHVTCQIDSGTTFSPSYSINARVYYKISSDPGWSGPIEMLRTGNSYITSSNLPAQVVGTTVEYYIESDFVGYNRFHDYSPMTDPPFPDVTPYAYTTRAYVSDYNELELNTGSAVSDMTRTGDNFWQGFLSFTNTVDHPSFLIYGYDFYNGINVNPGLSTLWGDANSRTNLPLAGQAAVGGVPIVIPEQARGQYVVRFDEGTRVYSVQRIAYQDFDTWPASDEYFEESYDADVIQQHAQDFDDWSTSSLNPMTATFEAGWTNVVGYPYSGTFPEEEEAVSAAGFYKLYSGVVVTQLVGHAAMLRDLTNSGEIRTTLEDSLGSFSFDARAANPLDFNPVIYSDPQFTNVRITATLAAFDLPTNTYNEVEEQSFGRTHKSLIAGYQDDDNYYEVRFIPDPLSPFTHKRIELRYRIGGINSYDTQSSQLTGFLTANDSFSLNIMQINATQSRLSVYQGATVPINNRLLPAITNGFGIGAAGMDAGIILSNIEVHGITNITQTASTNLLYEESFTNGAPGWVDSGGVWTVTNNTYRRQGYTGPDLGLTVDHGPDILGPWVMMTNITGITHSDYRRYRIDPQNATSVYVRIRHTDGDGHLIIDNIRSEVWQGSTINQDGWSALNAWITHGETGNGLEMRGSRALSGEFQYLQSLVFSNGVSVISFDYKSVTGTNHMTAFSIDYKLTNAPSFFPLTQTTNNPVDWTPFHLSIEQELRPQIEQIRISNVSTNPAAGLMIDNVLITEPVEIDDFTWWAYNALVSGNEDHVPSPLAPVADNEKGAYINNGIADTGGASYTNFFPCIQSPYLRDGIGEISFLYRAWDSTPSTLQIVAATNRYQPDYEWITLTNLTVSGTTWQSFNALFYDATNRFVKFRIDTSTGSPERVAIDNLLISAPFASDIQMKNLRLIPAVPRFNDNVRVAVDVYDLFFNPVITSIVVKVQQGTNYWGQFPSPLILNMELTDTDEETLTYTYQTIDGSITSKPIDTVMQYQVEVGFDGFFVEGNTSPKLYDTFENPDHYWPIDLNLNHPFKTPYYFSLSCLPGQVWINALNILDDSTYFSPPDGQFVEIVGKANVDVGQWRLQVLDTDWNTNAIYSLPPGTMIGEASNHYGYIVFGQTDIAGRDYTLTNTLPLESGIIQLVRSMGAVEHAVAYDDYFNTDGLAVANANDHIDYAGNENDWVNAPLALVGYGSNRVDFTWWVQDADRDFRIGTNNLDQTLVPWPDTTPDPGESDYTGTVLINGLWLDDDRIVVEIETQSENLTPVPWYTTNLVNAAWQVAPDPFWSRTGTIYNITSGVVTGAPRVFYSIIVSGFD